MTDVEKNKRLEKLSNIVDKGWILGVIGFYIYLYIGQYLV